MSDGLWEGGRFVLASTIHQRGANKDARIAALEDHAEMLGQSLKAEQAAADALRARVAELESVSLRLASAADAIGIELFDTDSMDAGVAEFQAATLEVRQALAGKQP